MKAVSVAVWVALTVFVIGYILILIGTAAWFLISTISYWILPVLFAAGFFYTLNYVFNRIA